MSLFFVIFSDVLRQRMMVAEFVARQQSGSPVNGETANQNHNSNMPGKYNFLNFNLIFLLFLFPKVK